MKFCHPWIILWLSFVGFVCLTAPDSMGQIFSERLLGPPRDPVITRPSAVPTTPQELPTPKSAIPLSIDEEPLSLSDARLQSRVVPIDHQVEADTPLSLQHQVWQRMLDLERENAQLAATLDYERKLAEYQQRTDGQRDRLMEEVTNLRAQLENDRTGQRDQSEQFQLRLNGLLAERDELQSAVKTMKHKLDQLSQAMRGESEKFQRERQQWQKTRDSEPMPEEKVLVPGDESDASLPPATPEDDVSTATGGVQIFVHQASWIDE